MKKYFIILAMSLLTASTFAQKGEKAAGVNLGYGTEISNLGIGAKFQYGITDAIRAEASFDYFLKKDGLKMWDVNINAHYLFPIVDKFKVYPLVGLTYSNWNIGSMDIYAWSDDNGNEEWDEGEERYDGEYEGSGSTGKFGVNLGAGIEYAITNRLNVNFEVKYQLISDFSQAIFGIGLAYKF